MTTFHHVRLPLTNLHYLKCGAGAPLIIVPATISRLENWLPLAQFMGQRFETYFFELPGHGESTPFRDGFKSDRVAQTVEAFMDELGFERINLMGFSFGGILALQTLNRIEARTDRVILLSPAVSKRALPFSARRRWVLTSLTLALKLRRVRESVIRFIKREPVSGHIARLLTRVGKVEDTIEMQEVLDRVPKATMDVLAFQIHEILTFEMSNSRPPFTNRLFFAMSLLDPMLSFGVTLDELQAHFSRIEVHAFNLPYHQPPEPITYAGLVHEYSHFLDAIE